jgi:hypothetical protein
VSSYIYDVILDDEDGEVEKDDEEEMEQDHQPCTESEWKPAYDQAHEADEVDEAMDHGLYDHPCVGVDWDGKR